jgi:hypothetical protein
MAANLAVYAPACGLPLARLITQTPTAAPEAQKLADPAVTSGRSVSPPGTAFRARLGPDYPMV